PHVGPDDAVALDAGIGARPNLRLEVALCRLGGHVDALATDVELPAVIDATEAILLIAAEEHRGGTLRAGVLDEADGARGDPEGDQVLAQHAQAHRRTVRRR